MQSISYDAMPVFPSLVDVDKRKDRSLLLIIFSVCLLHFLAIKLSLFFSTTPLPNKEISKKIIVNTVQLHPPPQSMAPLILEPTTPSVLAASIEQKEKHLPAPLAPLTPSEPAKEVKKEIKEGSPKKTISVSKNVQNKASSQSPLKETTFSKSTQEIKKTEENKKSTSTKKTTSEPTKQTTQNIKKGLSAEEIAVKKANKTHQPTLTATQEAAQACQRELLAKAKENMAKIGETRSQINIPKSISLAESSLPNKLENLHIHALPMTDYPSIEFSEKEMNYRNEISNRLKLALRLPVDGEVRLKLTLERSGKVIQVQVIHTDHAINKHYIENTLHSLSFPSFADSFPDCPQYTFVITLNNKH